MLWLNCDDANMPGGRNFHNMATAAGVMDGGWGWGGKFADFNNDGLLDIFTVNGFVTGSPGSQLLVSDPGDGHADQEPRPSMRRIGR